MIGIVMRLASKLIVLLCVFSFSTGAFALTKAEKRILKLQLRTQQKVVKLEVKYADDPVKLAEVVAVLETKTEEKVTQIEEKPSPN